MTKKNTLPEAGFTLMELMITMVIIGVIAAIAFPSYQESVRKSRRTEAKTALLETMSLQEQYFSENRSYASRFDELNLGAWGSGRPTENNYYLLNITVNTLTNSVTVNAAAQGSQAKDLVSGYGLSSNGSKFWVSSVTKTKEAGWE